MIAHLELADYLAIAERVLGLPAEVVANFDRIGLAESAIAAPQAGFGGIEAYPDFETKAAVLCWHLVKNHPLPDGTSDARSLRPWNSLSATDAHGCQRQAIRTRPTRSFAPPRAGR